MTTPLPPPPPAGWWLASDGRWYPPELHPTVLGSGAGAGAGTAAPGRELKVWPAVTLLTSGVVLALVGLVLFGVSGFRSITGLRAHDTPALIAVDCRASDYYVYERTGSDFRGPGFSFSRSHPPTLQPGDVVVTAPDGTKLATWAGDGSETIQTGSSIYADAVGFHVSKPAVYEVEVTTPTPTSVVVAPSLGSVFLHAARFLILFGIGAVITVAGAVLLIVMLVRRSHLRRTAAGW